MKRLINVHKGEATAGRGEVVLKSDIRDRSCFVIVARDAAHKIGCLAHALFINGSHADSKRESLLFKDAKEAVDKMISNMEEVKARKGSLIVLTDQKSTEFTDTIVLPKAPEYLAPIVSVVALQLFAYYATVSLGHDPDKPRNLAKSVTVE